MEFRQLTYALQLAAERNFSRAAEKLHIAQPSLSQQIAKLERELGVLLFQRNTGSIELTDAGAAFVGKARRILDMSEQLRQEMQDYTGMRRGRVVVGSLPITGAHVLPLVLPAFKLAHPDIDIDIVEDTTSRLEELTSQGKTDLCLLSLPLGLETLVAEPLVEEAIMLAVPPAHAAAGLTEIAISALKEEPFIVLKQGQGFRQIAIDLCERAGFAPRIAYESGNIETVQSLVAAGMGIAFVPEMVARDRWSRFVPAYVRLAGSPSRTLVIARRRGRYLTKAAHAFIQTMRAHLT